MLGAFVFCYLFLLTAFFFSVALRLFVFFFLLLFFLVWSVSSVVCWFACVVLFFASGTFGILCA